MPANFSTDKLYLAKLHLYYNFNKQKCNIVIIWYI